MDPRLRKVLVRKRTYIIDNIHDISDICDHFIAKEILSIDAKDKILSKPTNKERKQEFLDILPTLGPKAFGELLEGLKRTKSDFIVNELTKELQSVINSQVGHKQHEKLQLNIRHNSSDDETTTKSIEENNQVDSLPYIEDEQLNDDLALTLDGNELPPEVTGIDRPLQNNLNLDYPERYPDVTALNLTCHEDGTNRQLAGANPSHLSAQNVSSTCTSNLTMGETQSRDVLQGDDQSANANQQYVSQVDVINQILLSVPQGPDLSLTSQDYVRCQPNHLDPEENDWLEQPTIREGKQRLITDQELAMVAQGISPSSFYLVGALMGFKKGRLEQYQANCPYSTALQFSKMFCDWKAACGSKATLEGFVYVMRAANVDQQEYKNIIVEYSTLHHRLHHTRPAPQTSSQRPTLVYRPNQQSNEQFV